MTRSVWKGPFVDGYLLKKAEAARGSGRKDVIKTWSRRSTILPQFVGVTFGVYNGKKHIPVLVTEDMVKSMKPGSVIVDLAVEAGGNCPLSELDKTVVKHGVTLVGDPNLAASVAADASALYARNLLNFLNLLCDPKGGGAININREDDIIAGSLIAIDGAVVTK